jgi:hypothetical protein
VFLLVAAILSVVRIISVTAVVVTLARAAEEEAEAMVVVIYRDIQR